MMKMKTLTLKVLLAFVAAFVNVVAFEPLIETPNNPSEQASTLECPLSWAIEFTPSNFNRNITVINPQADVFFTVLLPELDCRKDLNSLTSHRDSLIYLNAIKYAINLLNNISLPAAQVNNNNGNGSASQLPKSSTTTTKNSQIENKSFSLSSSSILNLFPLFSNISWTSTQTQSIKYGAKIIYVNQQTDRIDHLKCQSTSSSLQPSKAIINDLAIIDGAHLFDKNIKDAMDRHIPIIPLTSSESMLTAPFRANLILNLLDILEWRHFAVITSKHEDSLNIIKVIGQITLSESVCINDILEIPWESEKQLGGFEKSLSAFMRSVYHRDKKIPILVISNHQSDLLWITQLLLENHVVQIQNHQFFFTAIPSPEFFEQLKKLSKLTTVFTLTSKLPDIALLDETKHCFEMSGNFFSNDLWKNWLSFSPIRYIIFMSIALRLAQNDICGKTSSKSSEDFWCDNLVRFERKLFFNYLSDLEDKVEMPLMTLSSVDYQAGKLNDLLRYDGQEFKLLDSETLIETSDCTTSNSCNSCIKFRQSRTSAFDFESGVLVNGKITAVSPNDEDIANGHHHDTGNRHLQDGVGENRIRVLMLNEKENHPSSLLADVALNDHHQINENKGDIVSHGSEINNNENLINSMHMETYEISLGLLLPLHKTGQSILDCSTELNLPAYYIYEASKWIINKINQNNYLIPGIEIKLELIDSCSSPFYATQELAHLTSSEAKVQPIAFVSSIPRDHYKQIADFISSINYTLIATQDISFMDLNFGSKFGVLQTATSGQTLIKALIEQIKMFGWRYVSIVVDQDELISTKMFKIFQEFAIQEKICYVPTFISGGGGVGGTPITDYNATLSKLFENQQNGANIVILLTSFVHTMQLIARYRLATLTSSSATQNRALNENLHFISVRDQNLETIHGFEQEYLGSIFIRESIGSISHFDNYFLDLVSNPQNTKDQLLFNFMEQCGVKSAQCLRTISSFDRTITINTMQAILSIVGGFARMRNETCVNEKGICQEMLINDFHQKLLKFILNTRSMRIDSSEQDRRFKSESFDIFEFAPDGTSARDLELLNFKHDFSNGLFRFDNIALYNYNQKSIIQNPNIRYTFYKYIGFVNGQIEYNETEFLSSDCLNLKKCSQCEPQTPEFIYMPSWDNLIVSGIFDVHAHSVQNPFVCEKNQLLIDSVQNVEAFIWALDLINNDPSILPGVHLGSLIFDSCSSYQKTYRDVSNFLSNSLLLGDYKVQNPNPESLLGFIVDGGVSKILDSVLDLTNPLKMMVMSTDARETKYNDVKHYSQFLGFSLPNNLYIDALITLLKQHSWTYISVVYENKNSVTHRFLDAYGYFQHKTQQNNIQISTKESFDENNIENHIKSLRSHASIGSKVIVLFLSKNNLNKFLSFNLNLSRDQQLPWDQVLFITIDSQQILSKFGANQKINVVSLSQEKNIIPEFENHFLKFSLQTNVKNPWFTQLWEQVYGCKGFSCYKTTTTTDTLKSANFSVSPQTTNIIHSVMALAHGLELVRQRLCPNTYSGLCSNFHNQMRKLSQLEHSFIKQSAFVSLDGSQLQFKDNSNFIHGYLNIFNLHSFSVDAGSHWVSIGNFDYEHGLIVSKFKSKFYGPNDTEVSLSKVISICQDPNQCQALRELSSQQSLPLIPFKESKATIAFILPLHSIERTTSHGQTNFTCGHIVPEMFEKLLAFYFALDHLNQQQSGLAHLNALVIDICSVNENKLKTFFDYNLVPKIVSVLSFIENNDHLTQRLNNQFLNLLGDYNPFLYNFQHSYRKEKKPNIFFENQNNDIGTALGQNNQVLSIYRSIIDLCNRMKWITVNVIYSNEFNKNYFTLEANKNNICIDQTMHVSLKDVALRANFRQEWISFANKVDSNVLILLTGSEINDHLLKQSDQYLLENFIWVGDKNLKMSLINFQKEYRKSVEHAVIVKRLSKEQSFVDQNDMMETIENFSKYFNINNQRVNHKTLNGWLHEYWQRKFHCFADAQRHDPKCFDSKYARKALNNVKEIKQLVDFVKTLGNSINKFMVTKCNNETRIDEFCLIDYHLRNELKNQIVDELSMNNYYSQKITNNEHENYEVEVVTNRGKTINIFNSFNWINITTLVGIINNNKPMMKSAHFICKTSCNYCALQLTQSKTNRSVNMLFSDSLQSPLMINETSVHRTWAIIVSILSTLGLIMVLICVLYFILIFPVNLGTTIVGYQILIGLFFCFLINFAFMVPNTNLMCWVRQFGLPFAYCIILSGFFVKTYNYWCQLLLKTTTKTLKYNSQCAQLFISFVFIVLQLLITLITMHYLRSSSNSYKYEFFLRCSFLDPKKFLLTQMQAVFPSILLVILFCFVLFFASKTFDNLESRWIIVCNVLGVITWIVWLIFVTINHNYENDSFATIVANLVTAFVIIFLLYIRKLYLFSRISRKILKERRMNIDGNEPFADAQQQYGAFKTCNENISWNTMHNRVNFRQATRSPFEGDYEDNVSSCGSVKSSTSSQVQCQELYPMEVYDNQLSSSIPKIGQSTRSIYDLIDDENMK